MDRKVFHEKRKRILKTISICMVVILSVLIVFGFVYLRFGIAGIFQNRFFAGLLGINEQQNIDNLKITDEEIEKIDKILGYNLKTQDRSSFTDKVTKELALTPQGASYLISSFLSDKNALENLQLQTRGDDALSISAIVNVGAMAKIFGESKEIIEGTVGKLPDNVPVLSTVSLKYQDKLSSIEEFKLGNLTIPENMYTSLNGNVDEGIGMFFDNALDINLNSLSVSGDNIVINADFPAP